MDIVGENLPASIENAWDIVWKTFENASLTYDQAFTQNITKTHNQSDDASISDNPAKLGIFTGLLIACLADFRADPVKGDRITGLKMRTILKWIFNLFFFVLFTPLVTLFLCSCFLYRKVVALLLRKLKGDEFIGLLEGTDCVWAMEDEKAFSVINVLALLRLKSTENNEEFRILEDLKRIVRERLISLDFDKLCWLRDDRFGYYYWKRSSVPVDLDERIRWLEDAGECCGECLNIYGGCLRRLISSVCNKPLPNHHCTNWEILVGRKCRKAENSDKPISIPVLFRIHHSLGDGVALLRLLLEAMADSRVTSAVEIIVDDSMKTMGTDKTKTLPVLPGKIANQQHSQIIYYTKDLLEASMPFSVSVVSPIAENLTKTFVRIQKNVDSILQNIGRFLKGLFKNLIVLISIPSCLLQQALYSMDNSALHGVGLTGEKIISCWMESDFVDEHGDYGLLEKIRDIKNLTGSRFGDVVLAALSANLHNYFVKVNEEPPKSVTVVIPARMSAPSKRLSLKNRFSVGLLPLCISEINGDEILPLWDSTIEFKCKNLLDRLKDVSKASAKLRSKPDYVVNYWVMTWLSAALPKRILKPILKSYSTMVFSNLPGPSRIEILGNSLERVAFWIPHRGTTGIGFSFLTYGGRAHFSVIADKGIVANEKLLDEIIRGTVNDIERLHEFTTSCTRKFCNDTKAPTETGLSVHQKNWK